MGTQLCRGALGDVVSKSSFSVPRRAEGNWEEWEAGWGVVLWSQLVSGMAKENVSGHRAGWRRAFLPGPLGGRLAQGRTSSKTEQWQEEQDGDWGQPFTPPPTPSLQGSTQQPRVCRRERPAAGAPGESPLEQHHAFTQKGDESFGSPRAR